MVAKNFDKIIAVSGAHGKTTTTAMIAWIFKVADKSFTAHIGGEFATTTDIGFGTGSEYFITEACEYSKSFLKLRIPTPASNKSPASLLPTKLALPLLELHKL